VVRVLLVADAFILAVVGAIAALFVERPAGLFFAGGAWALRRRAFWLSSPHRSLSAREAGATDRL